MDRVGQVSCKGGRTFQPPLTSRKILMAFEQVTPVVPQGTFSVTMRKVPLVVLLPPQWSWNGER